MSEELIKSVQEMLKEETWTRATISNYSKEKLIELAAVVEKARNENCTDEIQQICDEQLSHSKDSIIALYGAPKRELMDKPNSAELEKLMEQRKNYLFKAGDTPIYAADGEEKYRLGAAAPILSQGDLMGCVMLLLSENDSPLAEADQSIAKTAAGFLGRQMES